MGLDIYYIGYVTKKPEYGVNSVNLSVKLINRIDGFIEEREGDKYLNINTEKNKAVLEK